MKLLTVLMLCAVAIGCGYGTHMTTPTTTPAIASFNPPNATAGGPAFSLQVMGQNFSPQAFVTFNNQQMTTVGQTTTGQVTAMIPQAAIATAQTVQVTVTNPGTGGIYGTTKTVSQPMMFTINP